MESIFLCQKLQFNSQKEADFSLTTYSWTTLFLSLTQPFGQWTISHLTLVLFHVFSPILTGHSNWGQFASRASCERKHADIFVSLPEGGPINIAVLTAVKTSSVKWGISHQLLTPAQDKHIYLTQGLVSQAFIRATAEIRLNPVS